MVCELYLNKAVKNATDLTEKKKTPKLKGIQQAPLHRPLRLANG